MCWKGHLESGSLKPFISPPVAQAEMVFSLPNRFRSYWEICKRLVLSEIIGQVVLQKVRALITRWLHVLTSQYWQDNVLFFLTILKPFTCGMHNWLVLPRQVTHTLYLSNLTLHQPMTFGSGIPWTFGNQRKWCVHFLLFWLRHLYLLKKESEELKSASYFLPALSQDSTNWCDLPTPCPVIAKPSKEKLFGLIR